MDKYHISVVNMFNDIDRLINVKEELEPPPTKPYVPEVYVVFITLVFLICMYLENLSCNNFLCVCAVNSLFLAIHWSVQLCVCQLHQGNAFDAY